MTTAALLHPRLLHHAVLAFTLTVALSGCDKGNRDENFRPLGGSGGSGGSGGTGAMDASLDACDCADDAGDEDAGGSGGSGGMDAGHDANVPPPPFTAMGLLMASGQCALGHYAEFETRMELLVQATESYATEPTVQNRQAAQQAFVMAMAAWQRAELFQFGPAARSTNAGGQNLRDQIYFFPTLNRCLIDQQVVNQRYAMPTYTTAQASSRGLGAIEYLLFTASPDNVCGAQVSINSEGTWAALSTMEREQRRADYAHAAATDVLARARLLTQAWEPSGENFMAQWVAPSEAGAFATEQEALAALVLAIFYLDTETKDDKLAIPLALPLNGVIECINAPATCPERLESPRARISADNIRQNLIAFRQVFQGCDPAFNGLGIDDWLRSIDQGDLAERIVAALDGADAAAIAVGSLEDATSTLPPTQALALHAAIKAITDLLKTELLMVLNVPTDIVPGGDVD